MRLKLCAMTNAASAFAIAGACFAERLKTDWGRSSHLDQYRTYERVSTRDPLMFDRIKSAGNAVLASRSGQVAIRRERCCRRNRNNAQSANAEHLLRWGWLGMAAFAAPGRPFGPTGSAHSWSYLANKKKLICRGAASGASALMYSRWLTRFGSRKVSFRAN
jgi:hypothetical protein